eukprot:XP_011667814.1 PREDICTED: uncharacterized protein LOC105439937 [Strongylocentrotus purpuratus]
MARLTNKELESGLSLLRDSMNQEDEVPHIFVVLGASETVGKKKITNLCKLAEEALSEELVSPGKERLRLMYSMIRKQTKLDELQTAQSQAINEENYEQAEILTTECNSLEEDLHCIPRVTLDDGVGDIFSSRTIIHEKRKRQRSEWILALHDLQNQQEDVISKMREGRSGDPEGQKLKLDTQKTELDRAMGHVLLDKNHVEKREAQLWARIDEKTADLRETRDKLAVQKGKVQECSLLWSFMLVCVKMHDSIPSLRTLRTDEQFVVCSLCAPSIFRADRGMESAFSNRFHSCCLALLAIRASGVPSRSVHLVQMHSSRALPTTVLGVRYPRS